MSDDNLWSRVKKGRLVQVLLVYLGASWLVLQVVGELRDTLGLPPWIGPTALTLLLVGFVVILATAWVQSHPLVERREAADEVPSSWDVDLKEIGRSVARGRLPHLTWARALLGGLFAFSLLFGLAGLYVVVRDRGESFGPREAVAEEAPEGIAVLPFAVRGAALEEWREGMVDLLSTGLDGAAGLRAIDSRTVLARWEEMVPAAGRADEAAVLDVARRTGARYAVLGTAVAIGPDVRLVAEVHELEDGRRLGQARVEGPPDSVLALVDRLSMETLGLIVRTEEGTVPRVDVASVTTSSLPALKAYLEGEVFFRRGELEEAIEAYERAVAADSLFALAWFRLGGARGWTGESLSSGLGAEAVDRALALVHRLPEREAILVRAAHHKRRFKTDAIPELERAVRRYPDDPQLWYELGDTYLHVRQSLATWEDVTRALRRAVELAPRFAPYRIHLIDEAIRNRADSAATMEELAAYERLGPGGDFAQRYGIAARLAFGDSATRAAALERVGELDESSLAGLAGALEHPRFWETRARVLERLREVGGREQRIGATFDLAFGHVFNRGWVDRGVTAVRSRGMPPEAPTGLWLALHGAVNPALAKAGVSPDAFPVPPRMLDSLLERTDATGLDEWDLLPVGAWAVERGREEKRAAIEDRLAALADSAGAAGDSSQASRFRAQVEALEGYAAWRRGDRDRAARLLERLRSRARHWFVAWSLARLHREAGRLEEAARYFGTFMVWAPDPFASYHLGRIHEELDQPERAREHYELFVASWAEADPELQPLVREATRRLAALTDRLEPAAGREDASGG